MAGLYNPSSPANQVVGIPAMRQGSTHRSLNALIPQEMNP
jgi:hypothetical protein